MGGEGPGDLLYRSFWWELQPMVNSKSLTNRKYFNSFGNNMSMATKQVSNNVRAENSLFLLRSVPPTHKCQFVLWCFTNMIYYWPCYYMAFLSDFFINSKCLFGPFRIAKERAKSDDLSLTYLLRCVYSDYHSPALQWVCLLWIGVYVLHMEVL